MVAVVSEAVAAHVGIGHYNPVAFTHKAQNMFLVESLLLWAIVAGAVERGDFFTKNGRPHVTVYTEFPLGVNGNGESARALRVCLGMEEGIMRVLTTYPVEAGIGTKYIHT